MPETGIRSDLLRCTGNQRQCFRLAPYGRRGRREIESGIAVARIRSDAGRQKIEAIQGEPDQVPIGW